MTTSTKSATALLNEMNTLQAKLNLTLCKCCGKKLDTYVQQGMRPTSPTLVYGTCKNPRCNRFTITREINELAGMTEADVARFTQATVNEYVAGRSA